jgi:diguanylate cyclase (GGDEF)-like protein
MDNATHYSSKEEILDHIDPRSIFRYGLFISVFLILIQVRYLYGQNESFVFVLINNLLTIASDLLAISGMALGAWWSRRVGQKLGSAWWLFTIAMVSWGMGDILWGYYELIIGEVPAPFIGDPFYLLAYPLFFIGVLRLLSLKDRSVNTIWIWLDFFIVLFSALGIYWNFLIGPLLLESDQQWLSTLVSTAYPVGDLILVMTITLIFLLPHLPAWRTPLLLMLVGHLVTAIGDGIYNYQSVNSVYDSGSWFNILYSIGPLVLMLSGISQATTARDTLREQRTIPLNHKPSLSKVAAPFFWLLFAYFMLIFNTSAKQALPESSFSLWIFIIVVLLIFRQLLAVLENRELEKDLRRINEHLEKHVTERTSDLIKKNKELEVEMEERRRIETALREREERLAYMALHDSLTGLPNRALLFDRISQAIHHQQRSNRPYAVIFLDLDNFKIVNDSLGHNAGDQLLTVVGQKLNSMTRSGDTVSRVGGDEFILLLEGFDDDMFVPNVVDRIQAAINTTFHINGRPIYITASMGVVIIEGNDQEERSATDVIRDADTAMYSAKTDGKARQVLFNSNLRTHNIHRLEILAELHQSLKQDQFVLHYQPIMNLRTETLTGFEALIRWQHPSRGLLLPAEFIPIAEEHGFIDTMTYWVLEQACRQMQEWRVQFPSVESMGISINLSARSLHRPSLIQWVREMLQKYRLPPNRLTLEVVETALIQDVELAKQVFSSLRNMGIRIAVDDFGVGYSSLSYINEYPIDTLKIDQSFINRLSTASKVKAVVRSMVILTEELGLKIIAEGVETMEQKGILNEIGCDFGQGYLFSPALPVEEVHSLISRTVES